MDIPHLEVENAGVEGADVKVDNGDLQLQLVIHSRLFDTLCLLVADHVCKTPVKY